MPEISYQSCLDMLHKNATISDQILRCSPRSASPSTALRPDHPIGPRTKSSRTTFTKVDARLLQELSAAREDSCDEIAANRKDFRCSDGQDSLLAGQTGLLVLGIAIIE